MRWQVKEVMLWKFDGLTTLQGKEGDHMGKFLNSVFDGLHYCRILIKMGEMNLGGNFAVNVGDGCVKKRVVQRGICIPAQYWLQNRQKLRESLIFFFCLRPEKGTM